MDGIFRTPSQALYGVTRSIIDKGVLVSPRNLPTFECLNVSFTITEPMCLPLNPIKNRRLSAGIATMELLQLVAQVSRPDIMVNKFPQFAKFLDDGEFHGAYGPRLKFMTESVIDLLKRDPLSRQAVLTIFDSESDIRYKSWRDVPCTVSIQFLIRDLMLHARVSMRSNDVYLGLPYDLAQFIGLQAAVAHSLSIPVGTYHHSVGSMHLYEKNRVQAIAIGYVGIDEPAPITNFWGGEHHYNEMRHRAAMILSGYPPLNPTTMETYMHEAINP